MLHKVFVIIFVSILYQTTQEAFLKTQEFHDRVAQENTDWAKKL